MAVVLLKTLFLPLSVHELTLKNIQRAKAHVNAQSQYVGLICDPNGTMVEIMERKIWSEYQLTPFENRQFYAVKDADGYLRHEYGDYMKLPPKEQQIPKHDFIAVYWKD